MHPLLALTFTDIIVSSELQRDCGERRPGTVKWHGRWCLPRALKRSKWVGGAEGFVVARC